MGAPTLLNDDLKKQIRLKVLDGLDYKQIQEILEIASGTWDTWVWDNYQGFRDLLTKCKHEKIVKTAEANLQQLLQGDDDKIRADLTKFALSTLAKIDYSSRTEQTGADGKDLVIKVIDYGTLNTPQVDTREAPASSPSEQSKI